MFLWGTADKKCCTVFFFGFMKGLGLCPSLNFISLQRKQESAGLAIEVCSKGYFGVLSLYH